MRGEIADYKESLRRRVALLKGVPASALQRVYDERLRFNPGAERLVAACQAAGLKTLLVSGGFTFFTDRVRDRLRLRLHAQQRARDRATARSTGRMVDQPWGDICDGAEKSAACCSRPAPRSASRPAQAIAVGDGANDLPMMAAAGLSVAYHAKPKVREAAMVAIDAGGLDRLLESRHALSRAPRPSRRIAASVVRLVITSASSFRWSSVGRPRGERRAQRRLELRRRRRRARRAPAVGARQRGEVGVAQVGAADTRPGYSRSWCMRIVP